MLINGREFETGNKCYIAGILNLTPDSFSDGGKWRTLDGALRHTEQMIVAGADMIDVGGESTRPGYAETSEDEEVCRTAPVIEAICSRFEVPISIDTRKSAVAKAAVEAGADMVNDISGFKHDHEMPWVVGRAGVACCLMHNRDKADYIDFMAELLCDLKESVEIARRAGVAEDKIIIDPGIGFAKTYEMNLEAINRLDVIGGLGYPVMLGASRKSFIGAALGTPVTERLEGSLAAAVIGVVRGCSFLRVHDVKETRRAVTMAEAILQRRK